MELRELTSVIAGFVGALLDRHAVPHACRKCGVSLLGDEQRTLAIEWFAADDDTPVSILAVVAYCYGCAVVRVAETTSATLYTTDNLVNGNAIDTVRAEVDSWQ